MKAITMFESSDGKRFETEEECRAHEELADVERIVGEYLEQLPEKVKANDRAVVRRANVARDVLAWYLCDPDRLVANEGEDDGELEPAGEDETA